MHIKPCVLYVEYRMKISIIPLKLLIKNYIGIIIKLLLQNFYVKFLSIIREGSEFMGWGAGGLYVSEAKKNPAPGAPLPDAKLKNKMS